jgi:hypothetical protein
LSNAAAGPTDSIYIVKEPMVPNRATAGRFRNSKSFRIPEVYQTEPATKGQHAGGDT